MKQYYLSSDDGYCRVAVMIIKDNHVTNVNAHCLDKFSGDIELYVVFVPNLNKKINLQSIY